MRRSGIAGVAAVGVALVTLWLSTNCGAGAEFLALPTLTGMLAAVWADTPARGKASRVALFLIVTFLVGFAIFICSLLLNASACASR